MLQFCDEQLIAALHNHLILNLTLFSHFERYLLIFILFEVQI
jgi:hypothetical protein